MNQSELQKAMNNHTPVYYIDDEDYDYHCKDADYEVAEADVYKVYIPQQDIVGTETYLQFEDGYSTCNFLIQNKNIFSDPDEADKEAVRRFNCYVQNLRRKVKRRKVKEAGEALAECKNRLKEISNERKTEI